ncbi:aspartic proteinase CDR1-like [Papaver somniferum]|uniref:aspartic proteinase CDR1-like n=1 Tax=Papaver somniferum TaxID=3469 RepID=UPI000E6FF1A2|nr:aspartic proteinase CDR1-like [Papaver somniferum]
MATLSSISSSALLPLLLVLILVSSSCFIFATSFSFSDHKPSTNPAGFSARLIHRDSPESPFYDPKLTDAERMRTAEERSIERYNHLTRRPNGVRAPIAYRLLEYTVDFGVGTPLVDTHAAMDTASDITWIQCRPCDNCYSQERGVPIFDPRKSSTYVKIECMDPLCLGDNDVTCDRDGKFCRYQRSYYDGAQSQGVFSNEAFWFVDTSHRTGRIGVGLAFGCGHNNTDVAGRTTATPGIFGLNREPASFITQLDVKLFSHCFVPKARKQTSLLRFGKDAIITGETTPIVESGTGGITDARYYVSLEGISVNNTKLNIPQGTFKLSAAGVGGVMIDTGSSNTHLRREAYELLLEELVKQIKLKREFVSNFDLCYLTYGLRDLIYIPDITLHFSGLDYMVQGWTTWTRVAIDNNIVCFMLKRAVDELTTIGAHQLQDVNVGYDLPRKLISLQNTDCRKVS